MLDLTVLNQMLENWRREKVILLPPNSEAQVISAFEQINRKCSADVVALYCATGGMNDGEMDSRCFTFWSLKRIIKEAIVYKNLDVAFGDFLIESHVYCFRYESENKSSVYTNWSESGELIKVADGVNEFFEIYLRNSEELGLF